MMRKYQRSAVHLAVQERKKNRTPSVSGHTTAAPQKEGAHRAALFLNGNLHRFNDAGIGINARRNALQQLSQKAGNRSIQNMVMNSQSEQLPGLQRSVVQTGIIDWIKQKIGSDPEGAVRQLDTNLNRASKILGGASSMTAGNPEMQKKIILMKENVDQLKGTTSGVVKVLDARDKVRKVWAFASAIESIPNDIAADPEKAAQAFGKVFKTGGELGEMLPPGPWTPYFKFLQSGENFFSDMLYGLDPKKRPSNRRYLEYLP